MRVQYEQVEVPSRPLAWLPVSGSALLCSWHAAGLEDAGARIVAVALHESGF